MEAAHLILQNDTADDFNICTGVTHSVDDMVRIVFESLNLDYNNYISVDDKFVRRYEPTICRGIPDKAKNKLSWEAKVSFEEMLKILIKKELEKRNLDYEVN